MTENLDLALTEGLELNSDNTDIGETWVVAADEVSQTEPGTKWGTGTGYEDKTSITDDELETAHSYNGNGSLGSRTSTTNRTSNTDKTIDGSDLVSPVEEQSIGVYYNWYAATAKSGTASITTNGAKATDSICPKGWKLPDNDGEKSFENLLFTHYGLEDHSAISSGKIRSFPLSFIYSGNYRWTDGKIFSQNFNSLYWTSTVVSRTNAYNLYFDNSAPTIRSHNNRIRAYGISVRCVNK